MEVAKKIIFFFLIFVFVVYFLPQVWEEILSWLRKEVDSLPTRLNQWEAQI